MSSENHDCDQNVNPNICTNEDKYGGMNHWRWNLGVGA